MGRRKIRIVPIRDDRNRQVIFVKRKQNLMKKAYELATLCNCEVAMLIFSTSGKMFQFSSSDIDSLLLRYTHYTDPHEYKTLQDFMGQTAGDDQGEADDLDNGDEVDSTSHIVPAETVTGISKINPKKIASRPTLDQRSSRYSNNAQHNMNQQLDYLQSTIQQQHHQDSSNITMAAADLANSLNSLTYTPELQLITYNSTATAAEMYNAKHSINMPNNYLASNITDINMTDVSMLTLSQGSQWQNDNTGLLQPPQYSYPFVNTGLTSDPSLSGSTFNYAMPSVSSQSVTPPQLLQQSLNNTNHFWPHHDELGMTPPLHTISLSSELQAQKLLTTQASSQSTTDIIDMWNNTYDNTSTNPLTDQQILSHRFDVVATLANLSNPTLSSTSTDDRGKNTVATSPERHKKSLPLFTKKFIASKLRIPFTNNTANSPPEIIQTSPTTEEHANENLTNFQSQQKDKILSFSNYAVSPNSLQFLAQRSTTLFPAIRHPHIPSKPHNSSAILRPSSSNSNRSGAGSSEETGDNSTAPSEFNSDPSFVVASSLSSQTMNTSGSKSPFSTLTTPNIIYENLLLELPPPSALPSTFLSNLPSPNTYYADIYNPSATANSRSPDNNETIAASSVSTRANSVFKSHPELYRIMAAKSDDTNVVLSPINWTPASTFRLRPNNTTTEQKENTSTPPSPVTGECANEREDVYHWPVPTTTQISKDLSNVPTINLQ